MAPIIISFSRFHFIRCNTPASANSLLMPLHYDDVFVTLLLVAKHQQKLSNEIRFLQCDKRIFQFVYLYADFRERTKSALRLRCKNASCEKKCCSFLSMTFFSLALSLFRNFVFILSVEKKFA